VQSPHEPSLVPFERHLDQCSNRELSQLSIEPIKSEDWIDQGVLPLVGSHGTLPTKPSLIAPPIGMHESLLSD
jgi:hypothetical protein